jgi:hypothetical protein
MDPVVPIGVQSYLPIPPVKRVAFAEVQLGKVYYVRYRDYTGPAWPQRLTWLLATVKTVTGREVVGSPVWFLERGWRRRGVGFSANPAQIDTDNGGREYYHFYAPQEPVGDPTAASVAAAVPAGGAGAPSAPSADPAPNNTAGDPVAPRRTPSRKRKRRSSKRRPLKSRK